MKLLQVVKPLTPGQVDLVNALSNSEYEIVGVFGPTGSGKSLFSLAYGIDTLEEGRYKKLVVVKPIVDVTTGEELTLAKAGPQYVELIKSYVIDVLGTFISWDNIAKLMSDGKLVFVDTHYLKGRTFDDSLVFIDDAQSIKIESLIEVFLRVGRNSRLIVAADPIFQSLRSRGVQDATSLLRDVLASEARAKVIDLGIKDIVRAGAKRGIKLAIEYLMRSRTLSESEVKSLEFIRAHAPDADVITIVELDESIKKYELSSEHIPSLLIVVKQGHLGRLVGKGGERINAIEKDLNRKVRVVELTLELTQLIRALHPISWVWKKVKDVDFVGTYLIVKISSEALGPFMGQKGSYIRFLDSVVRKLLGVGVKVVPIEISEESREKERKRKRS
ncbi:MAG: PhoH family protein [Sulfolobales archaeon]|nr:PhoH family protein [Sulfolobales archaeon]MCX8185682.1 PhoH family protein [Sulfolobales archaeon]MDW7969625.1 PhoH family protein [Sulfolobales archaeon]